MFIRKAEICMVDNKTIEVLGQDSQRVFEISLDHEEGYKFPNLIIEREEKRIFIPGSQIASIWFYEHREANEVQKQIDLKWEKVEDLTRIKSESDLLWFCDGKGNTFIRSPKSTESVLVSTNPVVARLLKGIEALEDQRNQLLQSAGDEDEKE
ncbi:hypothetical protein H1164_13845 [Thermoactinomyces daqus]|uniref:Uncharacterized protein n=1 Tax=Thermoactinomyces daqus TaxID=1329516 RepID=A0A7W1XCE0_9BACL|nr:hypothetical protein [Thermoactinomyces daqus]MBA4543967.1 hypothetical protein [Thermoactinomyces daqus]